MPHTHQTAKQILTNTRRGSGSERGPACSNGECQPNGQSGCPKRWTHAQKRCGLERQRLAAVLMLAKLPWMTRCKPTTGVLLAGGRSRRMFADDTGSGDQPRDKCLKMIGERTMLAHVIARLAPQVDRLVLNANGDPARFAAYDLPVIADPVAGFAGPLAGVLAGMRWSAKHAPQASHIVTVSTDAPFLPTNLVSRLAHCLRERPDAIAIATSNGNCHPVIGLWPVKHANDLERQLASGMRKVLHWSDRHGTLLCPFDPVDIGGERIDPFFNANTPCELAQARRLAAVEHSYGPAAPAEQD